MNLFTASRQLQELDEYVRYAYPRARGRTIIERVRWAMNDMEERINHLQRQVNAMRATQPIIAHRITPAPKPVQAPDPVPYDRETGLPIIAEPPSNEGGQRND